MKKITACLLTLLSASLFYMSAQACTDFRLIAKDNTVLITRSMEFALEMNSNLRTSPRGRQFTSITPSNQAGYAWTAKYGYVFLDGFGQDMAIDGMNENGLSFEYLYLPGETQYQTVPAGKDNRAIPYMHFGDWVLSNFKTVDEVRQALSTIYVYAQTLPGFGTTVFPVHAAIYDASGKSIVVEFVNGKMNIHDNETGILTNSPTYDWHITNLRNYINLSPYVPKPIVADGITYSATGQGAGSVGLPGDVSPPSRFVKTAFLIKVSLPANDAAGALNLAQHIINNVDIPFGAVRAMDNGKESDDLTQWVVFKDLTHKVLYYRTYNDLTIHAVALNKISLSENSPRLRMPIGTSNYVIDVTDKFLSAKQQ